MIDFHTKSVAPSMFNTTHIFFLSRYSLYVQINTVSFHWKTKVKKQNVATINYGILKTDFA